MHSRAPRYTLNKNKTKNAVQDAVQWMRLSEKKENGRNNDNDNDDNDDDNVPLYSSRGIVRVSRKQNPCLLSDEYTTS